MNTSIRSTCTCARQAAWASTSRSSLNRLPALSLRALHSSGWQSAETSANPLPWFVNPSTLPPARTAAPLATAPLPLPPPSHLPPTLHPLWDHLSVSPFLNKEQIRFIDARRLDGGEAWVEWVVVAELRRGREGGLRGAIEGVRRFVSTSFLPKLHHNHRKLNHVPPQLSETPLALEPSETELPFAPSHPTITGLPSPPSRHARARALKQAGKGPGMAAGEQASGWAMLDAGDIVVHVMTEEARGIWGLEEVSERRAGRLTNRGSRWKVADSALFVSCYSDLG